MIDYNENWSLLLIWKGSVVPKSIVYALPATVLSIVLHYLDDTVEQFYIDTGLYHVKQSFMWNALTVVITFLLGFRTRQALGRFWEGTSLLHQMRGEWFDASSCLMTFSRDGKVNRNKEKEVTEFRHTLLRLMSLMHAAALEEISAIEDDNNYEVLDVHGLDNSTLKFLRDCKENDFNRVEALQHMIQVLVTHNHHSGVLTIPPPILSRIYQTLSRGLVNLLNARKIKDTRFPFPYAQVILGLLGVHSVFTPVIFTQVVDSWVVTAIMTFLPVFGMWALNFIAAELEMPFGKDQNDLPLRQFQTEMNEALLMLIHDMADHLPHTSERVVKNFESLRTYLREGPESGHLESSNSCSFMEEGYFGDLGDFKPTPFLDRKAPEPPTQSKQKTEPPKAEPPKAEAAKAEQVNITVANPGNEAIGNLAPNQQSLPVVKKWDTPRATSVDPVAVKGCAPDADKKPRPPLPSAPPGTGSSKDAVVGAGEDRQLGATIGPRPMEKVPVPKASDKPLDVPGGDMSFPAFDLEQMYRQWITKTDIQVEEMKRNTESMHLFANSVPRVIDAVSVLTQAIVNTLDTAATMKQGNARSEPGLLQGEASGTNPPVKNAV